MAPEKEVAHMEMNAGGAVLKARLVDEERGKTRKSHTG